jgi:hypothetical protein
MTLLGIVLPSLLLALAVRRWVAPVSWRLIVLFLVLTLAFLHGAVFTSKLPVPVDEVARGYPYRAVVGEPAPRNPLTNDTVKLFLPWMEVAREELLHFRAPLWNRYSFSGYPLLGNGESAPFSPLFLATLFVPLPKQIVAMAGLKIFVALLFGYLFARRAGAGEAASCFAASAFAFSVFQTVFLYYSTTAVTALLPAALYALLEAQERGRRRDRVLVALVVATLLANGHPESVLHIAMGAAGLLVIDFALSKEKRAWLARFVRVPVAGAIAGLALSAPAWVPVLEQVRLSTRLADLRRVGGHAVSYPLTAAWAMVSPNGFGNPVRQNWNWIFNYSLVAASYVGLLVLALFATALVTRRIGLRERLWALVAVLLWLIAMGWSPAGKLLNAVPPFSITANDKLRFVALFLAAVVAARLLDRFSRWYVLFAALFGGAAIYVYALRPAVQRPWDLIAPATVLVLALLPRRAVPVAAFALLTIDLFVLNSGFNALVERRYYKPELPIVDALKKMAPREPYRIAGFDWMFLPNASAQYGLEDVRGSDPMSCDAYTELLKPIVVDDRSIDFDRIVNVNHPLLDRLNVRYLMTEPGHEPGGRWRPVYRGPDGSLFENPSALARFYVAEGHADLAIRAIAPTRFLLRVRARTPILLRSSQPATPGWHLTPGHRADDAFLGLRLPPGDTTVEVTYCSRSFWAAVPLALLTAALLAYRSSLSPKPVAIS